MRRANGGAAARPLVMTGSSSPAGPSTVASMRSAVTAIRSGDATRVDGWIDSTPTRSGHRLRSHALVLVVSVGVALVDGVRLLYRNWRLALIEVIPALWITAVVSAAILDLRRWEQAVIDPAERLGAAGWTAGDLYQVAVFATVGMFVYLCNLVFGLAATNPDRPRIRLGLLLVRDDPGLAVRAMAWGGFAGLLRLFPVLLPLPQDQYSVTARVGVFLTVQVVLFVAVPARLAGFDPKALPARARLVLAGITVAMSVVAVVPAVVVARLGGSLVDDSRPGVVRSIGVVLLIAAPILQIAGISVTKSVALASRLNRTPS